MGNEATARLKINKLLENSGWRLLDDENGSKNVLVESSTSKSNSRKGSIDYLLLDKYGKPFMKVTGTSLKILYKTIKSKKFKIFLSMSDDKPFAVAFVILTTL